MLSFYIVFFFILISFLVKSKHLMFILMSMEFMILMIFGMIVLKSFTLMGGSNFCLYFLIFSVCESVYGLAILIYMLRNEGGDYFMSFNLMF